MFIFFLDFGTVLFRITLDVKGEVNEGSYLQSDLKDIRRLVDNVDFQLQIDNIISDLNYYSYNGGDYNYLYSASYKVSGLIGSLQ